VDFPEWSVSANKLSVMMMGTTMETLEAFKSVWGLLTRFGGRSCQDLKVGVARYFHLDFGHFGCFDLHFEIAFS